MSQAYITRVHYLNTRIVYTLYTQNSIRISDGDARVTSLFQLLKRVGNVPGVHWAIIAFRSAMCTRRRSPGPGYMGATLETLAQRIYYTGTCPPHPPPTRGNDANKHNSTAAHLLISGGFPRGARGI